MLPKIKATPTLYENDAADWWGRVEREKNIPTPLTPTPKLEKLRQRILEDAKTKTSRTGSKNEEPD